MTLLVNYQSMNIQLHDLRKTINVHNLIPNFHKCCTKSSDVKSSLYYKNDILLEYSKDKKNFIVKNDDVKLLDNKTIYKLIDHILYLMDIQQINDKTILKIKFQRRKAKPYVCEYIPEITFPNNYEKVGILCVDNHNITNNIYSFLSSMSVTDTIMDITKFELSPGFLCILKTANKISMVPSSILIQDPFLDEGYEDTIIISYHANYDNNSIYID